jgi:hypothetical protein
MRLSLRRAAHVVVATSAKWKSGYAPVEMTKGRVVLPATVVAEQEGACGGGTCGFPIPLARAITTVPFVISTEAQRSGEICGFLSPLVTLFILPASFL